jgi:hypothetical protein
MPTSSCAYRGQKTANTHLMWDVFVTPSIPVVTTDFAPGEHERPWPPISSTLIYGLRDAVVVDSFITRGAGPDSGPYRSLSKRFISVRLFATREDACAAHHGYLSSQKFSKNVPIQKDSFKTVFRRTGTMAPRRETWLGKMHL